MPSVVSIDALPPNAKPTFDLEKIRKDAEPVPKGNILSLILTYLLLIMIAYAGWYVFALQPPKVTRRRGASRGEEKGGATVNESERGDQRIENTLFYVSLFSYAYFYQASDQSTAARFDLIRSVLERRTLWIDGFCGYNTADIINISNHYYSVKAPGTSLTGLLPWSLISWFVSLPLAAQHEPLMWVIMTYLTIVISISLPVALLVVVMYRFGKALGATPGRSSRSRSDHGLRDDPVSLRHRDDRRAGRRGMPDDEFLFHLYRGEEARHVARGFRGIPCRMGSARRFSQPAGRRRDRNIFAAQTSEVAPCIQLRDRRRDRRWAS